MFTDVPIHRLAQAIVLVLVPFAWMFAGGIVLGRALSRFADWEIDAYRDASKWMTLIVTLVIAATQFIAPQFTFEAIFLLVLIGTVWWPWYCRRHRIAPHLWWHQIAGMTMLTIGAGILLHRHVTGALN